MTERGKIYDEKAESKVVKFDQEELVFGKELGVGGYCVVNEVKAIKVPCDEENPPLHSRKYMSKVCVRKVGGPRYAVKRLSPATKAKEEVFQSGLSDLVIEARLLAVIQHANIIKCRGFASCGYFHQDFFIVMDRLQHTLDTQINRWKNSSAKCTGFLAKFSDAKKEQAQEIHDEKITAARGIARAIEYLHENNIIYRDLKPENIGFDVREDVKLFDFGLATEVTPSKALDDGTYKLTGSTGSSLYMAPEVAKNLPYNLKADSYSFGILVWQIIAMKTPFAKLTVKTLEELVVKGSHRPKLNDDWSKIMKDLMTRCWSSKIDKRPEFDYIVAALDNEGFGVADAGGMDTSRSSYAAFLLKD